MHAQSGVTEHFHTGRDVVVILKLLFLSLLFAPPCIAQEEQKSHPPGIELPDGDGRALLLAACTRCHDLKGLPAYKGYWDSTRWRAMIDSMIKNGAPLSAGQAEVLASYLALHFGRPSLVTE